MGARYRCGRGGGGNAAGGEAVRSAKPGSKPERGLLPIVLAVLALIAVAALLGGCAAGGALDLSSAGGGVAGGAGGGSAGAGASATAAAAFEEVQLVRVVDGDTIVVKRDGENAKVRFIGVDAPESVASDESRNTPEGVEASDYLKSLVREGQTLYLESDESDTDKYGRLLRYVWTERPANADDETEIESKMLGGIMVAQGYAQAKVYKPDTAHADAFAALMDEAVAAGRGVSRLWNE